jgi:serine/threonine protein kinase
MEILHQPEDIINQRYRIVTVLGQGAMGTTYEAEDLTNYQRVAIKSLSLRGLQDWKTLELFEREARVLESLKHPAIPDYLDYFQEDSKTDRRFYLVQELVGGESLADLIKKGWRCDEEIVKDILKQILEILQYLHSLKPPVIHRDIKPQNIIRRPDGRVYLVDFGAVQDVYRNTITRDGTFVGTLGYMAPEQFRGEAQPASDIYALGATALFLLTRRSPEELPQKRLKIDFRDRLNLSPPFADCLEKMLEPAIEDRCQSAKEAIALLSKKEIEKSDRLSTTPGIFYRQPTGSKVRVQKTQTEMILEIPPGAWGSENSNAITWMLFGTILLISGAMFFVPGAFAPIFSIPFLVGGFYNLGRFLFAIAGHTRLEMNSRTFRLQQRCLGFRREVASGSTADIYSVEVVKINSFFNVQGEVERSPCGLIEGTNRHTFAETLTAIEKEWLVAEIAHFLKLPHNSRRRLAR